MSQYLSSENTDDLGRMVLALLSEVWIMRDRMAILEDLLEKKAGISSEDIENYVPSPEFEATVEKLRTRLIENVVGAPLIAREREVDDILRHAGMERPRQSI